MDKPESNGRHFLVTEGKSEVASVLHSLRMLVLLSLVLVLGMPTKALGELHLSGIFGDSMVVQRDHPITVWGRTSQSDMVTVTFAQQSVDASPDEVGAWSVTLNPQSAADDGRELVVRSGAEFVVIHDVLVGDVWHASGQSNMAMNVGAVGNQFPEAQQHIRDAAIPKIRFCRIDENGSEVPLEDLPKRGGWKVCSPETVSDFSAVAFYFARRLNSETGVPIGIIDSSRGGTPIEPFIPCSAFHSHPTLQRELELGDDGDLLGIGKLSGGVRARDANWLPGRLFHSRIAPIARFPVRGVIWYQGESNCGEGEDPRDYRFKMRALITGWREAIGNELLPFYFVQLPGSGASEGWPYLREQQRLSEDLPCTGMVVTIDLIDNDIHPWNKIDVGDRLAAWALTRQYGKTIPCSGPKLERIDIVDNAVVIEFSNADSGLMIAIKEGLAVPKPSPETKLSHFEVADQGGQWHPAEAAIKASTVVVRSAEVSMPIAVRYAYVVDPRHCHLYSRDGLPASPFCSHPELLSYTPKLPP